MLVWRSFHGGLDYKVRTRRIRTSQSQPRIGTLLDLFVRVKPNKTAGMSADSYSLLVDELYNFVAPLEEAGAPVTSEPDASVGARQLDL